MTEPLVVPDVPAQVAINAVAAEVGPVSKTDENKDQGFLFRGIERILAAAGPAMTRNGITPVPRVIDVKQSAMERGANRNIWQHYLVRVRYLFVGPQGDHVDAEVVAEGLDNADKGISKAMTVAYKTALLQVLKIADPDILDPDYEHPEPQTAANRAQPRTTTRKAASTKKATPTKKVAAKQAAPKRLTPAEQTRELAKVYGAEHAAHVLVLIERLDSIADDAERAKTKGEFRTAFGLPSELPPDKVDEAASWVLEHTPTPAACRKCTDRGIVTVADGDEGGGSHEEPCDCPAGEALVTSAKAKDDAPPAEGECAEEGCTDDPTGDGTFCPSHVPF